jgi:hypothetical protein
MLASSTGPGGFKVYQALQAFMKHKTDYELQSEPQERVTHTEITREGFCVILDPFHHPPRITLKIKT